MTFSHVLTTAAIRPADLTVRRSDVRRLQPAHMVTLAVPMHGAPVWRAGEVLRPDDELAIMAPRDTAERLLCDLLPILPAAPATLTYGEAATADGVAETVLRLECAAFAATLTGWHLATRDAPILPARPVRLVAQVTPVLRGVALPAKRSTRNLGEYQAPVEWLAERLTARMSGIARENGVTFRGVSTGRASDDLELSMLAPLAWPKDGSEVPAEARGADGEHHYDYLAVVRQLERELATFEAEHLEARERGEDPAPARSRSPPRSRSRRQRSRRQRIRRRASRRNRPRRSPDR